VLALFLTLAPGVLRAQQSHSSSEPAHRTVTRSADRVQKPLASRLLTPDEGLAVLGAALESRHRHIPGNTDCSHLVHDIYERAGYPYPYASSTELYTGVDSFRPVTRPQPGDLVVWRGHVGLVINPTQHSFFSALRSGKGVEKYDAPYWKGRGRPHFFRYIKATPPSVLAAKTEVASLKAPPIADADWDKASASDPDPEDNPATSAPLSTAVADPQTPAIPRVQLINSARPTAQQVREALEATFDTTGEALRGRDVFKLSQSLIVFDSFEVKKIHLSGDDGWAEVRISVPSSVVEGHANLKKHSEHQHWGLSRRDSSSWELMLPPDAVYLPRALAVSILAHQLAAMADTGSVPAPPDDKKTQLARLLDVLLEEPPSHSSGR
jgi:hypothetical protein